ncbi:MAG TPA: HypC/HybG/HupF family hydrogenase formation chaperone [Candidatus Nanopelagicaceae bacterium]|jgi:hydrogenase expression/formation protein HypC|nr:HypC/HybG/HupF family hydrogenase formation chaperone [Candidatus Nanopelagicaceae bacterium]
MCLAIPGKIIRIDGNTALVDFDGIEQEVIIALILNPEVGKYIIVHAGYAIEQMEEKDALEAIEQWKEIAEDQSLDLSDML